MSRCPGVATCTGCDMTSPSFAAACERRQDEQDSGGLDGGPGGGGRKLRTPWMQRGRWPAVCDLLAQVLTTTRLALQGRRRRVSELRRESGSTSAGDALWEAAGRRRSAATEAVRRRGAGDRVGESLWAFAGFYSCPVDMTTWTTVHRNNFAAASHESP
jgi:hypothetical protein